MRAPASIVEILERGERLGRFSLLTRGVIAAGAGTCWLSAGLLGGFNGVVSLALVLTTIAAVTTPDSAAPLALILTMSAGWVVQVQPLSPAWSLVLALCVLVVHVAAARAATIAAGAVLDPASAWIWLQHTAVVAVTTTILWIVVRLLAESPGPGVLVVTAAAFVTVVCFGFALGGWTISAGKGPDHSGTGG